MFSQLFTCFHINWGKMKLILTKMKFKTGIRFSCEQNLPCAKRNEYVHSRWILRLMHMCAWNSFKHHPPKPFDQNMVIVKCSRNETSYEQNLFSRRLEISNRHEVIWPLMWMHSTDHIKKNSVVIMLKVLWLCNNYQSCQVLL